MTVRVRSLALLGFLLAPLASALASPRTLEFEHSRGWDAAARFLRSRLGAGELSARAIQRELRQHLALSRMGACKALRRAETRGVVDRIAAPGGDVLRAAPI